MAKKQRTVADKACRFECPVTRDDVAAIYGAIDEGRKSAADQATKLASLLAIWEPARKFIFGNGDPSAPVRMDRVEQELAQIKSAAKAGKVRLNKLQMAGLTGIFALAVAFVQYAVPALLAALAGK